MPQKGHGFPEPPCRFPECQHTGENLLQRLGHDNVTVRHGDGYRGWPEHAPFDAVIVTCAPENIPAPLVRPVSLPTRS